MSGPTKQDPLVERGVTEIIESYGVCPQFGEVVALAFDTCWCNGHEQGKRYDPVAHADHSRPRVAI